MAVDPERLNHLKDVVSATRSKMRVTKITATRAVKTRKGDFFCGLTAAWDSYQDDVGGRGEDLDLDEVGGSFNAMTLEEAQVAQTLLSMEAALGAWRAALSEGVITMEEYDAKTKMVKRNTLAHLSRIIPVSEAKAKIASSAA
jgi:hypothetical protein